MYKGIACFFIIKFQEVGMTQKVTLGYDDKTNELIVLSKSGKKLVGVRPSVFYHQPKESE